MGLLDDAIREHLDLKRRRGADPNEVERAESEALGPVRRDPFEQEDEFETEAGPAPAYDHEEEILEDEEYASESEPAEREADWGEAFDQEQPDAELPEAGLPEADLPEADLPEAAAPPAEQTRIMAVEEFDDEEDATALEDPAAPPPVPAGAGAETVEYDIEEALEAEPPGEEHPAPHAADTPESAGEPRKGSDEDVLEETPEFLQDTPDHDRLWFEQRPPKDFDFDG
jgi:hypothetical protein